jgi:non-ribosomal peptide synthetase component E (peptide arylation enzyme)
VLLQHPAVFDCAVIRVPDSVRDEAIKAIVGCGLSSRPPRTAFFSTWSGGQAVRQL